MIDGPSLGASLRRSALEFCVLTLLEGKRLYGLELIRQLGSEPVLMTSEGSLYPLLSRLRRAGWVETVWRESSAGPPRRYYSLTNSGRDVLERFKAEGATFRVAVDRLV